MAAEKKAEHVKRVLAIVEAGDYTVAMFGRLPANSTRTLWQANGSMMILNGIKYDSEPEENEFDLPFDMPKLVSD